MQINLGNGVVTFVDDEDYHLVSGIKWRAVKKPPAKTLYVVAYINGKKWTLHRWLLRPNKSPKTDHRDGDGLNNRRSNLRPCTQSQNMANTGLLKNNTSGFKGIHWRPQEKSWRAEITCNGIKYCLGYHKEKIEAAKDYDRKAVELFGEFARLNFPESGSLQAGGVTSIMSA